MKKAKMSIAPGGEVVTEQAEAVGVVVDMEPTPQEDPNFKPVHNPDQEASPEPEPEAVPIVDTRTAEQRVTDLQLHLEKMRAKIDRFHEVQTKHDRNVFALEAVKENPDSVLVKITIGAHTFSSSDPEAVTRFLDYQVQSYARQLDELANTILS